MKSFFRVVSISEPQVITKSDGSQLIKQQLVLREYGGQYEDSYVATWFGRGPLGLSAGMGIAASIRFRVKEGTYSAGEDKVPETRYYQEAVLQELSCLVS